MNNKPTLSEAIARVETDIVSRLGLDSPVLRFSIVRILAIVWGGVAYLMGRRNDYLEDQIFPATQSEENLIKEAARVGFFRNGAAFAVGDVLALGVDGETIPAGTKLKRSDGATYSTLEDGVIGTGGSVSIPARADIAGTAGNAAAGIALEFEARPSPDVENIASAPLGFSAGADLEDLEDFRDRFIEFERSEQLNGSPEDYVIWAKQVPGVTRAWSSPNEQGLGTVVVRFLRENDPDPIPETAEISEVFEYIETQRPATAEVFVFAPNFETIDFDISLGAGDNTSNRQAVENEINDLFFQNQAPGNGTEAGVITLDQIRVAIGTVVASSTLNQPTQNITPAPGEIVEVGAFTWS